MPAPQFVRQWYENKINQWENELCFRSTDRVVRPFEWGLDWVEDWPVSQELPYQGQDPGEYLAKLNQLAIASSDRFFDYGPPDDFRLENGFLRFTSPVKTPVPANNIVHAQWFPAEKPTKRAVIVLPHWNSHLAQHGALCRGIARFGISALRLSLPYHDFRMPAELRRADYAVSSNIGRTLNATRQAVLDVRACVDWLVSQGFERIGLVGTSLGSAYAYLATSHDPRIDVNVFNHCSTHFADVVWTGLSTIHVRQGLETTLEPDQLRPLWDAISPINYLDKMKRFPNKKSIFIYTHYDTTFRPEFSKQIVDAVKQEGIPFQLATLPCGHYTMGETPFKFMIGYHIINFLRRNL